MDFVVDEAVWVYEIIDIRKDCEKQRLIIIMHDLCMCVGCMLMSEGGGDIERERNGCCSFILIRSSIHVLVV